MLVITCCPVAAARGAPGDVKRTLALPCRYPAGLAADGTHLYVVDWRYAKIYQINPADGQTAHTWDAPTLKPHGIACGEGKLFISDSRSGRVFQFDPATGIAENTFEAPGSQPTGLAYDDGRLYILERTSRKIYEVLPEDGTIFRYLDVPDRNCACLAWDGRYFWTSNRIADELYMFHPENGLVVGVIPAPGPYAAGLVWLNGSLWTADFQTRKLYELDVPGTPPYRLQETRTARVEYLWSLYNYGPGEVRTVQLNLALPQNLPNQELLSESRFSLPAVRLTTDRWEQPVALFELPAVPAGQKCEITCSFDARVSAIRYFVVPENVGHLSDIPPDIRSLYTADGSRFRINSPFIQKRVKEIVGDEKNPYWIARKIYQHLIEKLEYEMVGGWDVPEVVLKRGTGSCSEYTFAFIALCRAAGVPARYQGSCVVRGDDASVDEAFHRWAQVYLPNYGWIPVDANRGDSPSPVEQCKGFGELANRFLITTQAGGDSEYLRSGYNSYAHYQTVGYCKVEEENLAFWEPLEAPATPKRPPTARPATQPAATP